jgi:transcriptional regulator with XRE-family HTH domain
MPRTSVDEQKDEALAFGNRLRWVRELYGDSPTRLAADAGVDTSTIRYIERGQRMPSVPLLKMLVHVLRISPQYLLYGSLEGVEPVLAAKLKAAPPELNWPASPTHGSTHNSPPSSARRPRAIPAGAESVPAR